MIIKVKNLGPIGNAEIDLSKQITIFCGPNSTGKTYLSYIVYAVLFLSDVVSTDGLRTVYKRLTEDGKITISNELIRVFLSSVVNTIKGQLGTIFGLGEDVVKALMGNFDMEIYLTDADIEKVKQAERKTLFGDDQLILSKDKGSLELVLHKPLLEKNSKQIGDFGLRMVVRKFLKELLFCDASRSWMLTVERNSIYTFKTELSLRRNEIIDQMQQQTDKSEFDIVQFLETSSRRYPLAIRNSLRIANDLTTIQKNTSPYADLAEDIEQGLLNGFVRITKNGDVEFRSNKARTKHLPIHMSSSIVKTMASLVIYLKNIARKGDLLIIDEPEMNFHPNVQILLARIFALMANRGIKMIISTHSDYIVREFNNILMASSLYASSAKELIDSFHYTPEMFMHEGHLAVKYFNYKRKSERQINVSDIVVTYKGFDVPSMDEAIEKQNRITDTLFDNLMSLENE